MKRLTVALVTVLLAAVAHWTHAEVTVEGRNVQGLPGQRVFLEVLIDYGPEFNLIVEEFNISFPDEVLAFKREASTIDLLGQTRTFPEYKTFLGGGVLENPASHFYLFSFFTTTPQVRSGTATMRAAFDILPFASPGDYEVSISGLLYDESECCDFPDALKSLTVTVAVPEPRVALMLISGLLIVGALARRRSLGR